MSNLPWFFYFLCVWLSKNAYSPVFIKNYSFCEKITNFIIWAFFDYWYALYIAFIAFFVYNAHFYAEQISHKNLAFFEIENATILSKGDRTMKKIDNKPWNIRVQVNCI